MSMFHKRKRSYNPWLLPTCLRKIRFFCKHICIPITIYQGIRTILIPTTGDIIVFIILAIVSWLLWADII